MNFIVVKKYNEIFLKLLFWGKFLELRLQSLLKSIRFFSNNFLLFGHCWFWLWFIFGCKDSTLFDFNQNIVFLCNFRLLRWLTWFYFNRFQLGTISVQILFRIVSCPLQALAKFRVFFNSLNKLSFLFNFSNFQQFIPQLLQLWLRHLLDWCVLFAKQLFANRPKHLHFQL